LSCTTARAFHEDEHSGSQRKPPVCFICPACEQLRPTRSLTRWLSLTLTVLHFLVQTVSHFVLSCCTIWHSTV
jgi:hypothetical protein